MYMSGLVRKVFGSRNDRLVKRLGKVVEVINGFEPGLQALSDSALIEKTNEFKGRLQAGSTVDDILPEAFAVVREASRRTMKQRHYDVQMIGGIILHQGKIAEMRTGEGKTLVATLPLYLNALTGKGVHLVTANDYLARRDADWMRPIFEFLGLKVGVIVNGLMRAERQEAYAADITYGTNNEFGFDYLRDNMVFSPEERVQRKLHFAVVDEVDSILIDEARTPLIISGADQDSSELYITINRLMPGLSQQKVKDGPGDYSIDEKAKQAFLTEAGHQKIEKLLIKEGLLKAGDSLYNPANIHLMHYIYAALKAYTLFRRDVEYIVRDNEVMIVDEHTGRIMPGRRWSDGIHQAVEAKEGVKIQSENQTLASITFQNYFRLYEKLAGMTGTADTEAYEFQQIYGLEVAVIPTNRPNQRVDLGDMIFLSQKEKFDAIISDIEACVKRKQPVLVGTISIETSEYLSDLLKKRHIPHQVLNAKHHEQEAEIVAEAGRPGSVTIATNMAGRGTDIVLGGKLGSDATEAERAEWKQRHETVVKAGGLHIVGTERHESRRIDNQLRGRSARQGDPGSTHFYLSLHDNLMRIFISDNITALLSKLGLKDGESLTHPWVTRAVENAQRKVEGHNFDIRKQLLDFDDVANDQRRVIYQQRNELMESKDISDIIQAIQEDVVNAVVADYIPPESLEEQWDVPGLMRILEQEFSLKLDIAKWLAEDANLHEESLKQKILAEFLKAYQTKETQVTPESLRNLEKVLMLSVLDSQWKDHLVTMEYMRQSIHLRGYAQKDPKQEYKREAFTLFTAMLESIKREVIGLLMGVQLKTDSDVENFDRQWREGKPRDLQFTHEDAPQLAEQPQTIAQGLSGEAYAGLGSELEAEDNLNLTPFTRQEAKVGRNDPCPCGSTKKYKQCHGRLG
jgi:preprotein translocase subunit SecA